LGTFNFWELWEVAHFDRGFAEHTIIITTPVAVFFPVAVFVQLNESYIRTVIAFVAVFFPVAVFVQLNESYIRTVIAFVAVFFPVAVFVQLNESYIRTVILFVTVFFPVAVFVNGGHTPPSRTLERKN
jgi:hypothetical protein